LGIARKTRASGEKGRARIACGSRAPGAAARHEQALQHVRAGAQAARQRVRLWYGAAFRQMAATCGRTRMPAMRPLLCSLALFAISTPAIAGGFTFSPATTLGAAGTTTSPPLTLTLTGDGQMTGAEVRYRYDALRLTAIVQPEPGAACAVSEAPKSRVGYVRALYLDLGGATVPTTPRALCHVRFEVSRFTAPGSYTLSLVPGSLLCIDVYGNAVACSAAASASIVVP
jgi:hypothetical protein